MNLHLTREQYIKIIDLVERAISAPNKSEAKRYVDQLNYIATGLQGSANVVFSQLKAAAGAATGRVAEKERKVYNCHMELYKLESFVVEENDTTN